VLYCSIVWEIQQKCYQKEKGREIYKASEQQVVFI
jgi:hypothetical protein